MKKLQILLVLGFLAVCGLVAESTGPNAGNNRYNSGYVAVTKTATPLTIYTTNINNIHCVNGTASAATLTLTNTAGNSYITAVSIPANSLMVAYYGETGTTLRGIILSGSSDTAISCQITGKQ